jgi:MFS family permease
VVLAAAQLMVVLDATIVNVALPHIQRALGFSGTNLEWVVNAYALAFGGLLLLGGRAGDLRSTTSPQILAGLKSAFRADGWEHRFPQLDWRVTAGNSSPHQRRGGGGADHQ